MPDVLSTFKIQLAATVAAALSGLLIFTAIQSAQASELVEQGRDLAKRICSSCHAIERGLNSPIAAAPAFRSFRPRVDLDRLSERLQSGIAVGHPEMPTFVLNEGDARALVAYIESLQAN